MTIYSQHRSRGKVQVLATYRTLTGITTTTVTSVDDDALASPIVAALNRISAYATVPITAFDRRGRRFTSYPADHLDALSDRAARPDLRSGTHSLWYQHILTRLDRALGDLDEATAAVPSPVQTAIASELATEAQDLREVLSEYSEGTELADRDSRRIWDYDGPFVDLDDEALSDANRDRLDRLEEGIPSAQLQQGIRDLQVLYDAFFASSSTDAQFRLEDFSITDDPWTDDQDRFFLDVKATLPNRDYNRDTWEVEICRWEPEDPDSDDGTFSGEPVARCTCPTSPTSTEIATLLKQSGGSQEQLAAWAKTPVGEPFGDTAFVVTERFDL